MDYEIFNQQLQELLNEERKKLPYIEHSLARQYDLVLNDFYKYYVELMPLDSASLEVVYGDDDLFEDGYVESPLQQRLDELVDELVVRYELPLEGTVKITGTGLYVGATHDERFEYARLEKGYIIGEIGEGRPYAAISTPTISSRRSIDRGDERLSASDETLPEPDIPTVWQALKDAAVYDDAGQVMMQLEDLHVPIGEPGLTFALLEYQRAREVTSMPESEDVVFDVTEFFNDQLVAERFLDAENYLNNDPYSEDELREHQGPYEQDLGTFIMVDREALYTLSAARAFDADGTKQDPTDEPVSYLNPTILKINKAWRVGHLFVVTCDNEVRHVYVLPEDIEAVTVYTS